MIVSETNVKLNVVFDFFPVRGYSSSEASKATGYNAFNLRKIFNDVCLPIVYIHM
jgi:hypothetical protein